LAEEDGVSGGADGGEDGCFGGFFKRGFRPFMPLIASWNVSGA
jgi:hypothetical protein